MHTVGRVMPLSSDHFCSVHFCHRSAMNRFVLLIAACGIGIVVPVTAQQPQAVEAPAASPTGRPGQPGSGPPGGQRPGPQRGPQGGPPNGAQPDGGAKPSEGKPGETPGGKPGDAGDTPTVIRRQEVAKDEADLAELQRTTLGDDGKVAFQFRNQAWTELIDWLADLAGQPIDWLELPGDRVNITTPGRYSVAEVIDLLNRHLLGRGFTLLELDGGMTVVKVATVNPAIVPRIDPDRLGALLPHSYVRTSLDVGWLSAEELRPMISENGKLTALTTTNRIEAMDAAISLHQVAELLRRELDTNSREALAPEFKLRHIPAEEAKRLLEQFLGLSGKPDPPMSPEQMQQMQQMQMRMQQSGKPPAPEPAKPDIAVVANTRQNSILIQAPPDRVAVATEFLKRIDVPGETMTSLVDIQNRVEVFRLASLDPAKLIEIVQEMNILEPATRIRVDSDNRALIVSGSAADRYIIQQVITRLDGSGRSFEVLQLRRLDAVEVADSISFLMGKKEAKEDNSRQRYPFFFGGQSNTEKKNDDEFRVAANTRYRQVLLWANETEMAEVRNLLIKLGELPPPGGSSRVVRTIDADVTPETYRYLQELQRQWKQVSPNPIELPPVERFVPSKDKSNADSQDRPDTAAAPNPHAQPHGLVGGASHRFATAGHLTAVRNADDDDSSGDPDGDSADSAEASRTEAPADADPDAGIETPDTGVELPSIRSAAEFDRAFRNPGGQSPADKRSQSAREVTTGDTEPDSDEPIRIEVDPAGNLIIRSRDTAALDRIEEFMSQFTPPRRAYHTFTVRHASATWVTLNLEDFFEQEDDSDNDRGSMRWYFGLDNSRDQDSPSGLSKPAQLRFVPDIDTGTIVVVNATTEQLKTIAELIELWDVPEPVNERRVRYTKLVSLQYGRAGLIAETVKETYRDLLSSNDKAFQQPGGQGGQGGQGGPAGGQGRAAGERGRANGGSELVDTGGSGQQGGGADFSFKGKLSIGIDPVGNTLLVSAEGEPLLKLVCDMIDQLDRAARASDGVRVFSLSAAANASALETALRTLQSATPSAEPAAPGPGRPNAASAAAAAERQRGGNSRNRQPNFAEPGDG